MISASRLRKEAPASSSSEDPHTAFDTALKEHGFALTAETRDMLYHRTAGRPRVALAILRVTGTHGVKDLLGSHAVTAALTQEVNTLFTGPRGPVLKHAVVCASLLETVTPASLAAALRAYEAVTGYRLPASAPGRAYLPSGSWGSMEPEQLVLDLVREGLLVPDCSVRSPSRRDESWRVPQALAQGLRASLPSGTERQALSQALLVRLAQDPRLCGEQLVQARRAGQWEVLRNLMASRYTEIFTRWLPEAKKALWRLPRRVKQHSPMLSFIRLHLRYLPRVPQERGSSEPEFFEILMSLADATSEVVMEARSLRQDFLNVLQDPNEAAVTSGYALLALTSQGKFDEAVRVGECAQRRIDELCSPGQSLTKPAAEMFCFLRGVALGLSGKLVLAAEQFDAVPARAESLEERSPIAQKAADYSALIWAFVSGHREVLHTAASPAESTPAAYTRALHAVDVLDLSAAELIFRARHEALTEAHLWPLLGAVETPWLLLQGKRSRWRQRLDDFHRCRPAQLRVHGLGRSAYLRMLCDGLLSTGRLQQVREIIEKEDLEAYPTLHVAAARMWLIAGDYRRALQVAEAHSYSLEMSLRDRADLKFVASSALIALDEHDSAEEEAEAAGDLCAMAGTVLPVVMLSVRHRERVMQRLETHPMWEQIAAKHARLETSQGRLTARELKRRVAEARVVFPDAAIVVELTDREMEVLRLLQRNYTLQQIAEQECRALSTVKKQAQAVYRKLQVNSREQATQRAREMGILL